LVFQPKKNKTPNRPAEKTIGSWS